MENNCSACHASFDVVSLRRMVVHNSQTFRYCSGCVSGTTTAIPDVYYGYGSGTHTEENIAYPNGHPQAGQAIPFSSKREKALAMKIAGVREVGDRIHGGRHDSSMVPENRKKFFI